MQLSRIRRHFLSMEDSRKSEKHTFRIVPPRFFYSWQRSIIQIKGTFFPYLSGNALRRWGGSGGNRMAFWNFPEHGSFNWLLLVYFRACYRCIVRYQCRFIFRRRFSHRFVRDFRRIFKHRDICKFKQSYHMGVLIWNLFIRLRINRILHSLLYLILFSIFEIDKYLIFGNANGQGVSQGVVLLHDLYLKRKKKLK